MLEFLIPASLIILFIAFRSSKSIFSKLKTKEASGFSSVSLKQVLIGLLSAIFVGLVSMVIFSPLDKIPMVAMLLSLVIIGYGTWKLLQSDSPWPERFASLSLTLIIAAGVVIALVGPTKAKSMFVEITGEYIQKTAFDLRSGEPLSMGYINLNGEWKDAYDPKTSKILTPSDCRPEGSSHFGKSGEEFPYSTHGTCFSPVSSGVRLTPINNEALKASQKLDEPANIVAVKNYQPQSSIQYPVTGQSCDKSFTGYENCEKVTFKGDEGIIRSSQPGTCIGFYPAKVVKVEEVGENTYLFKTTSNYITNVFFYDIPTGETVRGFKCG